MTTSTILLFVLFLITLAIKAVVYVGFAKLVLNLFARYVYSRNECALLWQGVGLLVFGQATLFAVMPTSLVSALYQTSAMYLNMYAILPTIACVLFWYQMEYLSIKANVVHKLFVVALLSFIPTMLAVVSELQIFTVFG